MKAGVGTIFVYDKLENGHDTFPNLAQLFNSFPMLEKIVIETEHRDLLALFPAPRDTAESFRSLGDRGVEIDILPKRWQLQSFHNMLYRNGIEKSTFQFSGAGRLQMAYETMNGEWRGLDKDKTFTFSLLDFVWEPERMVEKDRKVGWRLFKFFWRS
jgi:hypothetical protein